MGFLLGVEGWRGREGMQHQGKKWSAGGEGKGCNKHQRKGRDGRHAGKNEEIYVVMLNLLGVFRHRHPRGGPLDDDSSGNTTSAMRWGGQGSEMMFMPLMSL